jgi:hypothetical protein
MKNRRRFLAAHAVGLFLAVGAQAQRPPAGSATPTPAPQTKSPVPGVATNVPPAPSTVPVKYEGGVFGYNKKMDGTLTFDDQNRRLVFREKKTNQEKFSINYDAIASAFADTQSKRPVAADIASRVFPYGLPALLIKKKFRYLTLQFNDQDSNANGITSFKMQNKEILASVLYTLANKAGMTQRGEIFVRTKKDITAKTSTDSPTPQN